MTRAGTRGKGGGPIYIGSSTRGNEQTSKRQQRGIVNRVRSLAGCYTLILAALRSLGWAAPDMCQPVEDDIVIL